MGLVGVEKRVEGSYLRRVALRLEDQDADRRLVEAQVQDGIVEFAGEPQRPEAGALLDHGFDRGRRGAGGALKGESGAPRIAIDLDLQAGIGDRVIREGALERRQLDALRVAPI